MLTHKHTSTQIHTFTYMHIHTWLMGIHTCMHTLMHTHANFFETVSNYVVRPSICYVGQVGAKLKRCFLLLPTEIKGIGSNAQKIK